MDLPSISVVPPSEDDTFGSSDSEPGPAPVKKTPTGPALARGHQSSGLAPLTFRPFGVTGLLNLGETCFINSVIQCLSNIDIFRSYFRSGKHFQDINK